MLPKPFQEWVDLSRAERRSTPADTLRDALGIALTLTEQKVGR